jgi:hypothetical protein
LECCGRSVIQSNLRVLRDLLAGSSADVVKEAIALITFLSLVRDGR